MGHGLDMYNRVRQNRAQSSSNRQKFQENNRDSIYSIKKKSKHVSFKITSEKKLNKIKTEIRKRAKKERNNELVIYGIVFAFGLLLVIGLTIFLN